MADSELMCKRCAEIAAGICDDITNNSNPEYAYVSEHIASAIRARAAEPAPSPAQMPEEPLLCHFGDGTLLTKSAQELETYARKLRAYATAEHAARLAAEKSLRIAAGMLSTFPPYNDKHPEVALEAILAAAKGYKSHE